MTDDIIQEILLRLPVKSLARCKSLSKEWREFISRNPAFSKQFMDRNRGCSFMLGFYITKHIYMLESNEHVRLLPTYNRGISVLNKRKRDNDDIVSSLLDEPPKKKNTVLVSKKSPSFFSDPAVRVLGSSNGFLLCSMDKKCPLNYIIINPMNKLCMSLPVASASSRCYNHGFVCRSSSPQLDTVDYYKVVRGISPDNWQGGPLAVETISSDSNHWSLYSSFSLRFDMDPRHYSPIIISEKGLVHVSGTFYNEEAAVNTLNHGVIIFDESKEESVQVMDFPPTERKWICKECIGQSEGSILYARNEAGQLKIWKMNNDGCSGGWSLIHNVSVKSWFPQFIFADTRPEDSGLEFIPEAFHPTDQNVIFLIYRRTRLVYDIKKSEVKLFCDLRSEGFGSLYNFFPHTCGLMGPHLFLSE